MSKKPQPLKRIVLELDGANLSRLRREKNARFYNVTDLSEDFAAHFPFEYLGIKVCNALERGEAYLTIKDES